MFRDSLDIAADSDKRLCARIILVTGDTDCIPAMKHRRKSGIQIVLIVFPDNRPAPELLEQTDYKRKILWPLQN